MGYLDAVVDGCGCGTPPIDKGFLGWFKSLSDCVRSYPRPTIGMSFINIETRSLWMYDGVTWVNTSQSVPLEMIRDVRNAGVVVEGYAKNFYYVPQEVGGYEFVFTYRDANNHTSKVGFMERVYQVNEVLIIAWNGEDFYCRKLSPDPNTIVYKDGRLRDRHGNTILKTINGEKIEGQGNIEIVGGGGGGSAIDGVYVDNIVDL